MGKARVLGAYAPYTPNSKMDMRDRRKQFERQKEIADNATPKAELRSERKKKEWRKEYMGIWELD